jgi:dienelactone hydrolase
MKKQIFLFVALVSALYTQAQTYTIGTQTISYTDASRSNRAVGIDFRYPGTNAALATGQFPFVIFAHGFSMNQTPYYPYADSLAKRGYIVGLLTTETGLSPSHANFAQDLLFVYNKLVTEGSSNNASPFYQHVMAKGAFGGHSMGGGSTVLAAQYGNPQECSFTFAAATTNPSSITAAPLMTKPYLSFAGASDCIAPIATNQQPMYDSSGAPCKFLINIANGLHCQYGNANSACSFGEGFSGCATSSLTRQQQIDKTLYHLIPFLDYYLKGDCNAWTLFEARYTANTVDAKQRNCTNTVPSNPSITGSNSFCQGNSTVLTANPSGFNYVWNDNSTASTLSANAAGNYSVVVGNGTCSLPSVSVSVTENLPPATPSAITANDTVCSNISNLNISVTNDAAATQYNWTLPNGWSITGGNNTNAIQVSSGTGGGTISVTAENNCGTTSAVTKNVTVLSSSLAALGNITVSDTVCSNIANVSISVTNDPAATSYNWTLPNGWNITSGNNTNTIQVTSGSTGGTISVTAENNCVSTSPATKSVTVVPSNLGTPGLITGEDTVCEGISYTYSITAVSGADAYLWTTPNGWTVASISPDSTITYNIGNSSGTVTVAAVNGCGQSSAAQFAVTVNTAPSLTGSSIAGPDTLCTGAGAGIYYTLNPFPTTNDDYNWAIPNNWSFIGSSNSSAPIINVNSSGAITVNTSNSCGNSNTISLNVVVLDTPNAQITNAGNVLTASPTGVGYTYTWYADGQLISNADGNTYTPTQTGNYSVQIFDGNNCGSLSAETNVVISGVEEVTEIAIAIYPNPTSTGSLQITVGNNLIGAKLKAYDVTGKLVLQSSIMNRQSSIPTVSFAKGIYTLNIEATGAVIRKKFVVE